MPSKNMIAFAKRIAGLLVLGVVVQRVGVVVMLHSANASQWVVVAYGAQALGGLLVAIGLFVEQNRLMGAGVLLALLGLAGMAGAGPPLATLQFFAVVAVVAVVVFVYRRASHESDVPREQINTSLLTADQAQNFAEQKLELFGGRSRSDVSVSDAVDGKWRVRMLGERHHVEPMTEPQWQDWLKHHRADAH